MNTITYFLRRIDKLSTQKLSIALVALAMLVAAQIQYIQHGWINPDSVLYLESAKLIAIGNWHAAFEIFNWPLYSALIALVHQLTSFNIQLSAQILNVILFGIASASFIKIIALADGNNRTIVAGALILLSSSYLVGDILQMLLRDEGFWAFFLTSLVFFIRFYKSNLYSDAFFWQIFAIFATLFRVEAITYLIALPFSLFFYQQAALSQKFKQFLKCNFLSIIAIVSIFAAVLVVDSLSMKNFGRLNEVFTLQFFNQLTYELFTRSTIMSSQVLGRYLEEFAVPGLLMTFVYVIIIKSISATGIVNLGLAALAIKSRKRLINHTVFYILSIVALIALLNMGLIITKVFVLSSRYVLALSFVMMIFAAFYLADLFQLIENNQQQQHKAHNKLRWLAFALLTFLFLNLIKNMLPKQKGYNYMQDAISWVNQQNIPKTQIFYDDKRTRYYAGLPYISDVGNDWLAVTQAIEDKSIHQYHYLLIKFSSHDKDRQRLIAEKLPEYHEIKRFNSARSKKTLLLYQRFTGEQNK